MLRIFLTCISIQLILSCSCLASSHVAPATSSGSAKMSFPYRQGWLGADAAYSIPLGGGRDLWLFGDTFVGNRTAANRQQRTGMPRNSVGIARCTSGGCSIHYYWQRMYTKKPTSFFDTGTSQWYWPLDGFVWHGKLYIALAKMHAQGTGAFGFAYTGVTLATVPNYKESPDRWRVSYQTILTGATAIPGTSIVVDQGANGNPDPADAQGAKYAYFFTYHSAAGKTAYTALTRLPLAHLAQAAQSSGHWQYLSTKGWKQWTTAAVLPADTKHVMAVGSTEFTVRYHAAPSGQSKGKWLAVMPDPNLFDKRGIYSIADSLSGPWSRPETLYKYPEMQSGNPNYTSHVICYADKEHPELESPGTLTFTYACNSIVEDDVFKNMNLYHPIVVTVAQPAALGKSR